MTQHLSEEQISRYRQLLPSELLSLDDHVAECPECRNRLAFAHQTPYTLSYVKNDILTVPLTHISYELMESYLDEIADDTDREIVDTHVSICENCRGLMQTLQNAIHHKAEKTSWDKIMFLWRSPEYSTQFRIVAYAAIVSFFALLLSIALRQESELKVQLEKSN